MAKATQSSRSGSRPNSVHGDRLCPRPTTCSFPQVVYGYFPANSDGNDVIIWTDETRSIGERTRFSFPRQIEAPWLCIADYLRTGISSNLRYNRCRSVPHRHDGLGRLRADTATLCVKTVTRSISSARPRGRDDRGARRVLACPCPIRTRHRGRGRPDDSWALFRQKYQGGRYSWGYPACPDLEDNLTVAEPARCTTDSTSRSDPRPGFQYQPEQTTSAIICHHRRPSTSSQGNRRQQRAERT